MTDWSRRTFAPRWWWMDRGTHKVGFHLAWEWDTPAFVLYLGILGVRVGWDFSVEGSEEETK